MKLMRPRAWAWRIGGFRIGLVFEASPGDTIMVVAWLGMWAVRVGCDWDWKDVADNRPEGA